MLTHVNCDDHSNRSVADLSINILAKRIYENVPQKCVKRSMNYDKISSENVGDNKLTNWLKFQQTYKLILG